MTSSARARGGRYSEAERLGGPEIVGKLEMGRHLIGRSAHRHLGKTGWISAPAFL